MDQVEEIKQKIDIVDLISGYLELKKSGVNYRAICPFHSEKTPSFFVSPEKQIWHCFGCQKGGDIYTFIMEMEGLEFYDALKLLADRAGVTLKRLDPKITEQKNILSEINEVAANFYHGVLKSKYGGRSKAYLEGRGIQSKTIDDFKIGYAPKHFHKLENALIQRKGFKPEDVERAGLIIRRDRGAGYFDRFRERIMFPIRNIAGSIVGFSGRTLSSDPETAKYLNSPDTPIFSKSKIIFALDRARQAIKTEDQVVVVEGQMDVISTHQAGFPNVVASSGTALTPDQIKILTRLTENIVFAYDSDSAGEQAAKRSIKLVNQAGYLPKMVILPKGEDPDSLVSKDPKLWQKLIEKPILAMDYFFKITFDKFPKSLSIEDKRKISKEFLPMISEIADPMTQDQYIKKLASKLGTEEKFVFEALARIKKPAAKFPQAVQGEKNENPQRQNLEERVLGLLLISSKNAEAVKILSHEDFENLDNRLIYKNLSLLYNKDKFNPKTLQKKLETKLKKKVDLILMEVGSEFDPAEKEEISKETYLCATKLRNFRLSKIKKDFENQIKEAEAAKDRERVKELIRQFQKEIIKKLPEER